MKKWGVIAFEAFIVVWGIPALASSYVRLHPKRVLGLVSPVAEITPLATPSATPTATASAVSAETIKVATPSATPKPKPTLIPTPTVAKSETVNNFIDRFAGQYGVDPNALRHMAVCESGFRSNATNYIYAGLFQFDTTTWKNIRKEMGEDNDLALRFSAEEAVQTAAYAISKGKGGLWPNCFPH